MRRPMVLKVPLALLAATCVTATWWLFDWLLIDMLGVSFTPTASFSDVFFASLSSAWFALVLQRDAR